MASDLGSTFSSADVTESGQAPLLPGWDADDEEWEAMFPIEDLPELRERGDGYYMEPFIGLGVVGFMVAALVLSTMMVPPPKEHDAQRWLRFAKVCICCEAGIAVVSILYILFGQAGVIHRSPETCYPIPRDIAVKLAKGDGIEHIKTNIREKADGVMRTYCVRCLVWRPDLDECATKSHHCRTCMRCVTGFDHHCGVFGRCIVRGNMPCFVALIAMMFTGWATASSAFLAGGIDHKHPMRWTTPSPTGAAPTVWGATPAPVDAGRLLTDFVVMA